MLSEAEFSAENARLSVTGHAATHYVASSIPSVSTNSDAAPMASATASDATCIVRPRTPVHAQGDKRQRSTPKSGRRGRKRKSQRLELQVGEVYPDATGEETTVGDDSPTAAGGGIRKGALANVDQALRR